MILKKTIVLSLLSVFIFSIHSAIAQEKVYQLSSHILDITAGQPASGVDIDLYKLDKTGEWSLVDKKQTDKNGRVSTFLENIENRTNMGIYKLRFNTEPYFNIQNKETFIPLLKWYLKFLIPVTIMYP